MTVLKHIALGHATGQIICLAIRVPLRYARRHC
jgi:hypothetical protein